MTEKLGQPVIVENMPGASGQIGLTAVARAAPDGYTLGAGQGGNLVVAPHTYKNLPYDPLKDFTPVVLSTFNYLAIFASNDAPFKTIQEMVAYAKANPGKLTVATNGEGGFPHLALEDFRLRGGFDYTHVPYKGSAQIGTDLMGGQVQVGDRRHHRPHAAGARRASVRLLAVTNRTRVAALARYAGRGRGGRRASSRAAGSALSRRPARRAPIVNTLNAAMNDAMKQPDVAEKLAAAGLIISTEPPQFFARDHPPRLRPLRQARPRHQVRAALSMAGAQARARRRATNRSAGITGPTSSGCRTSSAAAWARRRKAAAR